MEVFEWWNLVFLLPPAGALVYLVFLAAGAAVVPHDADVDTDAHLEMHGDVSHDLAMDHAVAPGLEHVVDHAHAAAGHDEPGVLQQALSFLGLGRVPLSMLMMSFAFLWGFAGYAANQLGKSLVVEPAWFIWPSLVLAGVAGLGGTRGLAQVVSRFLPSTESYATSRQDLLGRRAEVRYAITRSAGAALLHDGYGNLLEVSCRSQQDEAIPPGSRVVLMHYDAREGLYLVRPDPLEARELPGSPMTS